MTRVDFKNVALFDTDTPGAPAVSVAIDGSPLKDFSKPLNLGAYMPIIVKGGAFDKDMLNEGDEE